MNRIEEIKKRLAYLPRGLRDGGFSDNSLAFGARLDIEYLLSKLEIAEKVLELLDKSNILKEVNLDEIRDVSKITTGTELLINQDNVRSIERSNKAKKEAKEILKQLRED